MGLFHKEDCDDKTQGKDILLSIKPYWVAQMIAGKKKVELKKSFSKEPVNRIFIYESSPIQKIRFYFYPLVVTLPIDELWEKTKDVSCVPEEWFFPYFAKSVNGIGLFFTDLHKIKTTSLDQLRKATNQKKYSSAPQNFYYLDIEAINFLLNKRKEIYKNG